MNGRKWAALVLAFLLALSVSAGAEEGGFGTYAQPDGVTAITLSDLRYFDAPPGLESMYDLMSRGNARADVYLFLMPNGLGVASVSRIDAHGGPEALEAAWPEIARALAEETGADAPEASAMTRERTFGFEGIRIRTDLTLGGKTPVTVQAEGAAFFRENDMMEIWQVFPDQATCQGLAIAESDLSADRAAMKALVDSFDFGGALSGPETVATEPSAVYRDPAGYFSLTIPEATVVITQATPEAETNRWRQQFAAMGPGGDTVFDRLYEDVAESGCTLMLLPELGLCWQVFAEDDEDFRTAALPAFYRLAEPVRASLETRFGSAQLLSGDGAAVLSGIKHAKLVYWLRAGQTDAALEVYAVTDPDGLLRELDLYTLMDVRADQARQESVLTAIRETLLYSAPEPSAEDKD